VLSQAGTVVMVPYLIDLVAKSPSGPTEARAAFRRVRLSPVATRRVIRMSEATGRFTPIH